MAGRNTYYVYELKEKVNKYGNTYIGLTNDLIRRAKQWKYKLKLEYIPELIVMDTFTNEKKAFDFEQFQRIIRGWPREIGLRTQKKMRKRTKKTIDVINTTVLK